MPLLIQIIIFLWLIGMFKNVLFWLYLWQLKEYHVGRFLDHFRTYKGERLIFGFLPILKFVLLALLLNNQYLFFIVFYILLLIYGAQAYSLLKALLNGDLKKPVVTLKTSILIGVSALVLVLYTLLVKYYVVENAEVALCLLAFDILTPLIVSAIILIIHPYFVLARNGILAKARGKRRKFKNLTVIGITGSYGKTSTKEFLTKILSQKFSVLSTPEHKNSEIGIAQTILRDLNEEHEIFIAEMGSYKKGGITLLCDMVMPKIGIVTGVNEQHLSTFRSMENLLSAEGGIELEKSLPREGMLVVNGDNKHCLNLYRRSHLKNKKVYSAGKERITADIWAEEISANIDSLDFVTVTQDKQAVHFHVNVLGKQNIQNLLGAILVAKELGMTLEEIAKACEYIKPSQAGIILKKGVHGINVIDSSYSSNPDGVIADLEYLDVFDNNKEESLRTKRVIIMPCLIELGSKSSEIHKNIGQKIAEICDLAIITTKDRFGEIKMGAAMNGMGDEKIKFSENSKEIFNLVTTFCKKDDVILLEGRVPEKLIKLLM